MSKLNIGLLFGGCSGEHDVSIASAKSIAKAFTLEANREKYNVVPFYIQKDGCWSRLDTASQVLDSAYPLNTEYSSSQNRWEFPPEVNQVDVWFPVLHGPNGEDGTIQGLLKLMQVPFVGSEVLGSAIGTDKIAMKQVFAQNNLPQVKYCTATRSQIWSNPCVYPKLCDEIELAVGYPCFVKPANLGSSVGISKVRNRVQLEAALDTAATYDRKIIIEAGVVAREVECSVLGNEYPKSSVVGEITYESDFYDYETKYTNGKANLLIPAPIPDVIAEKIREMAIQAFTAINAFGLARVDFFYLEATQEVLINEINTLPGFTNTSMYPQLWAASGIPFFSLVDHLVQLALEKHGTFTSKPFC